MSRWKEKYNIVRKEIIGMSHASASRQLYRMILLKYLKKLGLNICFRCKKPIEDVETLSLDHKVDWMNHENAHALFWDINNIAFSHKKCNVRGIGDVVKNRPNGMEWCYGCKQYLSIEKFSANNSDKQRRSVHGYCKQCAHEYYKKYYNNDKVNADGAAVGGGNPPHRFIVNRQGGRKVAY